MSNEDLYQLVTITEGKLPLLLHPDQYKYIEERLRKETK